MKNLIIGFLIFCLALNLKAQTDNKPLTGKISYISSQNVYVKFKSTENIKAGDTLYIVKGNENIPVLIVNNLSSTSCVCTPISVNNLSVSTEICAKNNAPKLNNEKKQNGIVTINTKNVDDTIKSNYEDSVKQPKFKQKITGSVAASSYSNFSNINNANSTRFRYQFSLNAKNIGNSMISAESNITFQHQKDNWNLVQENIFNALKVYNLSVKYDNNKNTQIVLGRKINPKISSMGAIDGLQYEGKVNNFFFGAIAGFRPDYKDYSFDFKLPQFGVYAGQDYSNSNGEMQNSFALIEQRNGSKTDRRFAYYQHSNSLIKNLFFFGSVEIELYKNIDSVPQNTFDLSSTYLVLNYRLFKRLSLSASYDNRKNIIYYESYKSYINQMLEIEARQGLSFQASYGIKNVSFGFKTGYRFPNKNSAETKNLYGFVSYNNIPTLKLNITGAVNYLETSYVKGKIYNLNISRDILKANLYFNCGYQLVNYSYVGTETTEMQNIINLNISWRFLDTYSLSVNYEKTFEKLDQLSRLNIQIRKRF